MGSSRTLSSISRTALRQKVVVLALALVLNILYMYSNTYLQTTTEVSVQKQFPLQGSASTCVVCATTRAWLSRTWTDTPSRRSTWWKLATSASSALKASCRRWIWNNIDKTSIRRPTRLLFMCPLSRPTPRSSDAANYRSVADPRGSSLGACKPPRGVNFGYLTTHFKRNSRELSIIGHSVLVILFSVKLKIS